VFSVVLRDITEQVELQKRLQRAVSVRDDVVGVVAHDLRNPVSAVKMLSKALLNWADTNNLPEDPAEQLRLIRTAALQMDRLIQDLLDITKAETGRLVVDKQTLTAVALLEGALSTLRPLIAEAGLELREDLPSALPTIDADPERIGQVLSNLIGNAIKATEVGGRITVRAEAHADHLEIAVSDNGSGIPPEQLPHIFDRFRQASMNIRSRGAGLGLPIAQGIVRAHGGRIWAESTLGKGSTFYFTLPVS